MEKATKIITALLQVLDQASFNGIDTRGMNQVMSIRQTAAEFVQEQNAPAEPADKETSTDGDDVPAAAE